MKLQEKKRRKRRLIAEAESILDAAEAEGRGLTNAEAAYVDRVLRRAQQLGRSWQTPKEIRQQEQNLRKAMGEL